MLNRDFREFAELLNAHGVDYLVVDAYALAAHGHPRYTGDIDFWISPTLENIDRLLAALNFKANKRAVGRFKDLADLEALEPPTAD